MANSPLPRDRAAPCPRPGSRSNTGPATARLLVLLVAAALLAFLVGCGGPGGPTLAEQERQWQDKTTAWATVFKARIDDLDRAYSAYGAQLHHPDPATREAARDALIPAATAVGGCASSANEKVGPPPAGSRFEPAWELLTGACESFEGAAEVFFRSLEEENPSLIFQAGARVGQGVNRMLKANQAFLDVAETE